MARLTLSQTGISSPLDIGAGTAPSPEASGAPVPEAKEQAIKPAPESQPPSRRQPQRRSRRRSEAAVPAPAPVRARGEEPAQSPAQGGGYPIQTSIPVDIEILDRAIGLSWSAGVALNTLIVATLQRALPATAEEAVELAVLERVDHPGAQRVERNVRLPRSLRSRLDELSGRTRGSGI